MPKLAGGASHTMRMDFNLLDSKFIMLNNPLQKLYGLNLKAQARVSSVGAQLSHVELPENSHRGGLLGMAAVLAVASSK